MAKPEAFSDIILTEEHSYDNQERLIDLLCILQATLRLQFVRKNDGKWCLGGFKRKREHKGLVS